MGRRERVSLAASPVVALTASMAFGEAPASCYEAYQTSCLTHQQQMTFGELRTRHLDDQIRAPRRKRSERSRVCPTRVTGDPALKRGQAPIGSIGATFTKTTYWRKDL